VDLRAVTGHLPAAVHDAYQAIVTAFPLDVDVVAGDPTGFRLDLALDQLVQRRAHAQVARKSTGLGTTDRKRDDVVGPRYEQAAAESSRHILPAHGDLAGAEVFGSQVILHPGAGYRDFQLEAHVARVGPDQAGKALFAGLAQKKLHGGVIVLRLDDLTQLGNILGQVGDDFAAAQRQP